MSRFSMERFVLVFASAFVSLLAAGPARAADATMEVAEDVFTYAPGDGYISLFVVTDDGVIAIEPVNTQHSTGMVAAIRAVTDQPIRYLLHSHNHWDHSAGGQVFRDAGATILAHEEAYRWFEVNQRQDIALPDEGWVGERRDLTLGNTTVEMHYVGMSHGLGMTVFRVAEESIVYVADLVTPNRVLFSIIPDFNINEWKRALSEIEAMDFEVAVFSHNESNSIIGTKADVTVTREYIEDLQAAIMGEFVKGTPFTQIPYSVKLPEYEDWAMYEEWLPLNAWRIMLDMHMGPFPWRPD